MRSAKSGFIKLFTVLLLVMVSAITLISGCRLINPGGDDATGSAAISTIYGRVVKGSSSGSQRGSDRPALLAADVSGAVGIPGAEVLLEGLASDPRYRKTTDASGTYRFTDVPPGEHRIIVKYSDPASGKTMKTRSDSLQVTETPGLVEAPDLAGEAAVNVVTGQLRDAEGNFLPEGTLLTLWGETFTVGKDGAFTSPALPASAAEAEILVQLPGGNNATSFTAPFVSDVVPAFVELKLGEDEKGNHAPAVILTASINGEAVAKVNPGAIVTLKAVGSDADSSDQTALTYTWSVTSGTLTDGVSALEKSWTAPDYFTVGTISVEVKDSKDATGKSQLPVLVGIDDPSQVDANCPTVTLAADVESIAESAAFNLTITFNEPIKDFEEGDITAVNATVSDFATVTARKVFKVKVTPAADGEVKVSVAENVAVDLSNNKNTASNIVTLTNTVTPPKSSEKAITAFSFLAPSVAGTINGNNIAVTLPFGTDVTALVAKFTASAKATVKVGDVAQVSGETANNFSSAVVYKVTAENGTTADYTVTVTVAANPAKAITAFDFASPAATGVVDETNKTVAITVPFGTAVTALTPTITQSGASVSPNSGVAQDFTNPVTYTVTAADSSTQNYVVTVTIAPEPVTDIGGITGTPKSGQTLTAGALTPSYAAVNYQWQVSDDGSSGWSNVSGETANTYVVDLGKTASGKYVRVAATGKDSYSGTVYSSAIQIWGDYTSANIGTLKYVPAGSFQRDGTPANVSTVSVFRMSQHEITRTQFSTIMGFDPSNTAYSTEVSDPVQMVNWYHAIAFCNKLSIAEGLTPAYSVKVATVEIDWANLAFSSVPTGSNSDWNAATCDWDDANGYRLPTEMEWMWAAMGADTANPGATNTSGYSKAFAGSNSSNDIRDYVWYFSNSGSKTHPAGTKLANELGLYGMSGNVWEWCWDWYGSYPAGSSPDYTGSLSGSFRVVRGGSFGSSAGGVTVAFRDGDGPSYRDYDIGFRVVRP